jgi:hypothetical protein
MPDILPDKDKPLYGFCPVLSGQQDKETARTNVPRVLSVPHVFGKLLSNRPRKSRCRRQQPSRRLVFLPARGSTCEFAANKRRSLISNQRLCLQMSRSVIYLQTS